MAAGRALGQAGLVVEAAEVTEVVMVEATNCRPTEENFAHQALSTSGGRLFLFFNYDLSKT